MAYMHKKIVTSTAILGAASLVTASAAWFWGGGMVNSVWPEKEEKQVVSAPLVKAVVEEAPQEKIEPPKVEQKDPPERHIQLREKEAPEEKKTAENKKPSLQEKWLEKVNEGGLYAFGKDNGYKSDGSGSEGDCKTLQPVRVRALIADSSSTDEPGMAWGVMSEDVQGEYSDGTPCIAIHAMAVVSFDVQKAGDYATNKAPVQVGEIWMQDGFSVKVDQPGKHIDGSIGVVGKANHHTISKTFAAIAGGAFRLLDNVTSIGQYNVSSGDVSDPFEEMIDKRLNRPSTISFTGGKVVEFQVLPVSTPGYENL
jgi:hypothetical protein